MYICKSIGRSQIGEAFWHSQNTKKHVNMEIRQLKYFINVAETGSFSEASKRCFLSQSAISQQIRALEDELRAPLFIRNPHKVVLTKSGQELLPLARQALKSFNECQEHMNSMQDSLSGQLNIGMSQFIEPFVRHAAVQMLKQHPDVRLNLIYLPTTELNRMLISHDLDIAFSINTPTVDEEIESEAVIKFHILSVMKSTHPLASKEKITFEDLRKYGIVMPEAGRRIYNTLKKYLDFNPSKLNIRAVVNDPTAAINLVQDTNFLTFLPSLSITDCPSLTAKRIEGFEMPLQSYLHHMKDTCMKHSAKVFLKILHEYSIPYCDSMEM